MPVAPVARTSRPSMRIAALRSLPPLPAIEPVIGEAEAARTRGEFDQALEHYKRALFLVDENDHVAQASLYADVAEVKLLQGKAREAETNFEKALARNPEHRRSLDRLVVLASQAEEWERVVAFRQKRADLTPELDEKVAELCAVADLLEGKLGDPKRAAGTLEALGLVAPGDPAVLERLRHVYVTLRAWPQLLDVLDELCRTTDAANERSAYRFAQADVTLGRLRDEPRGVAFLELALDENPQNDRALSALVAVRSRREEWPELGSIYERLIDRFAGLGDRGRAWEVCKRLGTLRRDRLLDGPGALEAFRGAVELRADDVESRAALAELHAAKGERTVAVHELEQTLEHAPFRSQTYRRLYELHQRAGRPDRAWLTATCLEELGAADVAHELVIEQFRPHGAIRPTTALDAVWWDEHLRARAVDPIVSDILRIVSGAAIALRLESLATRRKLIALDPTQKQDKVSTASIVRTFTWAARALGIQDGPDLYLVDDVPSGIAAVPAPSPATAIGAQVRTGMNVQQLAFLAGRHLTYYRPEHYALVFFPTLAQISSLVLASVRLVIPGISIPPPPDDESPLDRLGERLSTEDKAALAAVVARLDARGGRLDLLAWIRGVELTAARAGLLLAGDLRIAMRMLKEEERAIGELTAEAKRGDLLAYAASDAYATLRERMGIAILGQPD